jgi:Glycosyl transferase family 2
MTTIRLSGYTVTYNCIKQSYPLLASIRSMLGFCDEVIVIDAGSSDGTVDLLNEISRADSRLRVIQESVDFSHPRWALHLIGSLKARARMLCRGEYLWEMDADEVVGPQDYPKIEQLLSTFSDLSKDSSVLALPIAHFWGETSQLRTDIPVWRPRLSRNDARITHGVSTKNREKDELGNLYPKLITDPATDHIISLIWLDLDSEVPIIFPPSYSKTADLRMNSLAEYLSALEHLPVVLHLGTLNLSRTLYQCKFLWPGFFTSVFKDHNFDTTQWNPIFKKPWIALSDEEILEAATELRESGPVQFISRGLNPELKGFTCHQLHIPQAVKDWVREAESLQGFSTEEGTIYPQSTHNENSQSLGTTMAAEFAVLAGEYTEVHDLQVELPPHTSSSEGNERMPIVHRTIPVDVESLLHVALKALDEGQIQEGKRFLSFAENIAPKDPNVLITRIDFLLATNELADALAYAKRGLWLFPTHAEFRELYQQCLTAIG